MTFQVRAQLGAGDRGGSWPAVGGPAGSRGRWLLVGLTLAAARGLAPRPLGAQTIAPAPRPSARAVRVRIETDRAGYGAGDTIAVRLTLVNAGPAPLLVSSRPPWDAIRLVVTGPDGRAVAPTRPPDGRSFRGARGIELAPGEPYVQSYAHREWTALRSFGYGPLAPGRYTLAAVPLVDGPDVDVDDETVRSNRVAITVAPSPRRPVAAAQSARGRRRGAPGPEAPSVVGPRTAPAAAAHRPRQPAGGAPGV